MTDPSHLIVQLGTTQASAARGQLIALGETAFLPLLDAIVVDDMRQAFITDMMVVFLSSGSSGLDFLRAQRESSGWPRWNHAMQMLDRVSRIGEADVALLASLITSSNSDVSATARGLLTQLQFQQQRQHEDDLVGQVLTGGPGSVAQAKAILMQREQPQAVEVLWPYLRHENPKARQRAAKMLRSLAEENYLGLTGWLDDVQLADAAAAALGEIGERHDARNLLSALQRRPFVAAIVALGRLGDSIAIRPLLFFLADRHGYGYEPAIHALGEIGASAVGPLIEALQDDNFDMRSAAARALGETGNARAVRPLLSMWREPNLDAWAMAADALGNLEGVASFSISAAIGTARGKRKAFLERAIAAAERRAYLRSL